MKAKYTIKLLCIAFALTGTTPGQLDDSEKAEFAIEYRNRVKLAEEFPDKQEVKVIFVDLDFDGTEEALATSYGSFYEKGWDWALFRRVNGKWESIKSVNKEDQSIRAGSGVFARPGEVFKLIDDTGKIQHVVINRNYDKLAPHGIGSPNISYFYLDNKGFFVESKVASLEDLLIHRGSDKAGLIKSIEALKVDVFPATKTKEK